MITLKFSEEELKVIGAALGQLPYKVVAEIIGNIQRQVADQQQD